MCTRPSQVPETLKERVLIPSPIFLIFPFPKQTTKLFVTRFVYNTRSSGSKTNQQNDLANDCGPNQLDYGLPHG